MSKLAVIIVIIILVVVNLPEEPHWKKQGFDNEKQYEAFKEGDFEDEATFLQAYAEGIDTVSDWKAYQLDQLVRAQLVEEAVKAGRSAKRKYPTDVYKAACKKSWRACENNSDYVNEHTPTGGPYLCKLRAEEQAKYGEVDWGGWLDINFGSFLPGDNLHADGSITYIDTKAKYQNVFGAMVKASTYCQVDIASGNVLLVRIES